MLHANGHVMAYASLASSVLPSTTVDGTNSPPRRAGRQLICLLAIAGGAALALAPATAEAQERVADEHVRVFGAGTAFGGGFVGASNGTGYAGETVVLGPALFLPTLELQAFLPHEYSIDITIPITNIAVVSAIRGGFLWSSDVFFNFNFGTGNARGIVGPGLGFAAASDARGRSNGSLRLPSEFGLEIVTDNEAFGFKMMVRPWVEFGSDIDLVGVGGGAVALLGFSGYHRK